MRYERYLLKTDVVGIFTETLTTQVDTIFSDQTVLICARSTEIKQNPKVNTKHLVMDTITIHITADLKGRGHSFPPKWVS